MPRLGRGESFQLETGIDLGPWLTQSLIEAFTPKKVRKQAAEQTALAKLAELQPVISKLPEAEREKAYSQFFKAYGVYQPPWLRGLFGAGEEPILPLPKGTEIERRFARGPLGIGGRLQKVFRVPEKEPFKFAEPLALSPERESELVTFAERYYPGDEDAKAAILREAATGRWTTADERTAAVLRRATQKIEQLIAQGLTEEQAITKLPLEMKNVYLSTIQKRETEKSLAESLETQRKEVQILARERETRLKAEAEQKAAFRKAQLDLMTRKQQFLEQNTKAAQSAKTADQLMKNAQTAYNNYRNFIIKWNQEETAKEKQALMAGRDYLPNYLPIPTWEGWLADEGYDFQKRFAELEPKEGVPPSAEAPPTAPQLRKRSDAFNEIVDQFFR